MLEDEPKVRLSKNRLLQHLLFIDSYRDALKNAESMFSFGQFVCEASMKELGACYACMQIDHCEVDAAAGTKPDWMPDITRLNPRLKPGHTMVHGEADHGYLIRPLSYHEELGIFALGFNCRPNADVTRRFQDISRKTEMQLDDLLKVFMHLDLGVYRRELFEQELEDEIELNCRTNQPYALMMFDIDKFKEINDKYGHPIGDAALKHITGIIKNRLRRTDLFARYGGDEFCILLEDTTAVAAYPVADRLCKDVSRNPLRIYWGESDSVRTPKDIPLTISIGVTGSDIASYNSGKDAIKAADAALYESKRNGRNQATRVLSKLVTDK